MRLTLRTMLAYLDEILEPDDAEDIGKKIEESEFATSLVHRTRDCIRRLRLGAPPLSGKGMALDPNTVAEYLDNTLASERVPDFEKVCLESDVHLAEVGSCHQILTLVLGEPVEIDPASRERVYQLAYRSESVEPPPVTSGVEAPPIQAPPVGAPQASSAQAALAAKRSRPEVPDYLREPRSLVWTVAVAVLIAATVATLVGGGLYLFGPPEFKNYVASLVEKVANGPEPAPPADNATTPELPATEPTEPAAVPAKQEQPTETPTTGPDENAGAVGTPVKPGLEFPKPPRTVPDDGTSPPPPEPSEKPLPKPPVDDSGAPAVVPSKIPAGPETTPPPLPDVPPKVPAVPMPAVPEEPAAVGEGMGRYLSTQDVLLRFDPKESGWRRLPAKANVHSGDQLLALPTFSPAITLSNGVIVQPIGPALIELQAVDDGGVPGVVVQYGRVLMLTVGKAGSQVRVALGDRPGMAAFSDAESALAVEVRRVLLPGMDPEKSPAPIAADLYAASGQIIWIDAAGETTVRAPGRKIIVASPAEAPTDGELPRWITGELLTELDKRAARDIEHDLTTDRPVSLGLKELTESRKQEVRSLAVRSGAYIGEFDPFVAALNDENEKAYWTSHIDALRAALARSPFVAAQVRATFEKQRAEKGLELYRMLWGYNSDDLKTDAVRLVNYLDHEDLDFRVLSSWNLQNITGMTLAYRPADPVVKRRPTFLRWKEKLAEGKIVPTAPAAAPLRPAPAKPPAAPAAETPAPPTP